MAPDDRDRVDSGTGPETGPATGVVRHLDVERLRRARSRSPVSRDPEGAGVVQGPLRAAQGVTAASWSPFDGPLRLCGDEPSGGGMEDPGGGGTGAGAGVVGAQLRLVEVAPGELAASRGVRDWVRAQAGKLAARKQRVRVGVRDHEDELRARRAMVRDAAVERSSSADAEGAVPSGAGPLRPSRRRLGLPRSVRSPW